MKKVFFTLLILIPFISKSQTTLDSALNLFKYNDQGRVAFEKVVNSEISKSEMFQNLKKWIAINYKDYNSVVKIADETNGIVIYKGISGLKDQLGVTKFEYTSEITLKDKKARIRLYDIGNLYYAGPGTNTPIEKTLSVQRERTDKDRNLAAEFLIQQYNLFISLLIRIEKALITKDDF